MSTLRVYRLGRQSTAADTFAAIIAWGCLRRLSKKDMLAAIAKKQADTRASCAECGHLWDAELFNRAAVRRLSVITRRGSLLRLRQRVQQHLDHLKLTCPNCGASNSTAGDSPPASPIADRCSIA
jgi:transcription elongation factor Elf1